jgi:Gpi18-like mannosyltransferase
LVDKPYPALISFGVSAAIKAQAAFLAPFLILLAFKKKIPWRSFGMVPVAYFLMMLPAILAGRPVLDTLTVYLNQASEFQIPSFNAPNWYVFFPQSSYTVVLSAGLVITALLLIVWIFIYARRKLNLESDLLIYFSLVSVVLVPFLLPKMHDRYFYPADVLSIILAFYMPVLWFVAVAYQAISGLAYTIFLFDAQRQISLILATQLNTYIILYLLWKQSKLVGRQGSD